MKNIENKISKLYSKKLISFKEIHKKVGWSSKKDQYVRFNELIRFHNLKNSTIHDFGCGNGEFLKFLKKKKIKFKKYLGTDISQMMIQNCHKRFEQNSKIFFKNININKVPKFDYIISSGVFYIRNDISEKHWEKYVYNTIKKMYNNSIKGVSFNLLTFDTSFKNPKNYYPNLINLIKFLRRNVTKKIIINHSYNLWEFTLYLYK